MPKVSAEHRERVRESILDAAFACLRENGVKGVTARAIGSRAGVSPGTLYVHFDDKEDLFAALAERVAAFELDVLIANAPDDQPPIDQLRVLLDAVLSRHEHVVAVPALRELASRDKAVRAALHRFDRVVVKTLAPLVEKAAADGDLRDGLDAEAIVEMVDTFSEAIANRRFVTSRERVVQAFIDLITEGATP